MCSLSLHGQQDTLICDNGGFEQGFMYYTGDTSRYNAGSDACTPTWFGQPSAFGQTIFPSPKEFEIRSQGLDRLVGIPRVKFGSHAARLNSRYADAGPDLCLGVFGVNRLNKRFRVTEDMLQFTVWYALVLENPAGHINTQPYFSISCSFAPDSDLCIDAEDIKCEDIYADPDSVCTVSNGSPFDSIDVINWSCHRVLIDSQFIGQVATLEITSADCGLGCHFGYAYVDGICESCIGSALGAIELYDSIAITCRDLGVYYDTCSGGPIQICGRYTPPDLCEGVTSTSIDIIGVADQNLTVDPIKGTFCFEVPVSALPSCTDIYATIDFVLEGSIVPQQRSNTINVCHPGVMDTITGDQHGPDFVSCTGTTAKLCATVHFPDKCSRWGLLNFVGPEGDWPSTLLTYDSESQQYCYTIAVSDIDPAEECKLFQDSLIVSNGCDTIGLSSVVSEVICIEQFLKPEVSINVGNCNENVLNGTNLSDDYYFVEVELSGVMQSTSWTMTRELLDPYPEESGIIAIEQGNGPILTDLGQFLIQDGPWYLIIEVAGCKLEVFVEPPPYCSGCEAFDDVQISNVTCNTDGTWSFDIMVPGDPTKQYALENLQLDFGKTYPINAGAITPSCLSYTLEYQALCGEDNTSTFIICPPQPCNPELECGDLEVSVREVLCDSPEQPYSPVIDIEYIGSKYLCFGTVELGTPQAGSSSSGSMTSGGQQIGPFSGDVFLTIYECDDPCSSSNCSPLDPKCFKTIYIPDPDVCATEREGGPRGSVSGRTATDLADHQVYAWPNPVEADRIILQSTYTTTSYAIYTLQGEQILAGRFSSNQTVITLDQPAGLYIVQCSDGGTNHTVLKVIKL